MLGVLDRFLWLQFDELRILPDFGSGQPTVEDRVSCRVSAQALFIVLAAVRVLYEFWRKKSIGHLPIMWYTIRVSGSADNGPLPESNR